MLTRALALCALALLCAATANAQCRLPGFEENICLFDSQTDIDSGQYDRCENTNQDIFAENTPGVPDSGADCPSLIKQDGEDCILAYAKFACSYQCGECFKKVCKQACDDVKEFCPSALAKSCFSSIDFNCADGNQNCADLSVDESKLPDPAGGGGGGGGGDGDGSSGNGGNSGATNIGPLHVLGAVGLGVVLFNL